jgi:putative OPT family oligopeptide transporter
MPTLTAAAGVPAGADIEAIAADVFRNQVRFIGAGTMLVAAVWTLLKVIGPVIAGILAAIRATRARQAGEALDLTERDLPITIVGGTIIASMLPIGLLLAGVAQQGGLHEHLVPLIGLSIAYILAAGLIIAAITGYMAGLIGASNSPVSGVGIMTALGISLILAALFGGSSPAAANSIVAFALIVTAVIFGVATISNDNLQDLKTGQLVGATPWRQQAALIIGVIFGALVIPPILNLMNNAFGFVGVPGAGENALNAPQAALISGITKGIIGGDLDWSLIGRGAMIGVGAVIVDEVLKRTSNGKYSLPPLAVGMGMYLPMEVDLFVVVGATLGYLYNRWAKLQSNPAFAERIGTLMATGLIVGESLMGVVYAGLVAAAEKAGSDDSAAVLAVFGENPWAIPLAVILFSGSIVYLYVWTRGNARNAPLNDEPVADVQGAVR